MYFKNLNIKMDEISKQEFIELHCLKIILKSGLVDSRCPFGLQIYNFNFELLVRRG